MEKRRRFAIVSTAEIEQLVSDKVSENTKTTTTAKVSIDLFWKYLDKTSQPEDFISLAETDLN